MASTLRLLLTLSTRFTAVVSYTIRTIVDLDRLVEISLLVLLISINKDQAERFSLLILDFVGELRQHVKTGSKQDVGLSWHLYRSGLQVLQGNVVSYLVDLDARHFPAVAAFLEGFREPDG